MLYGPTYPAGNLTACVLIFTSSGGCAWCLLSYVVSAHAISWDVTGIEGPMSHRPYPSGPRRGRIAFDSITGLATDWTGNFCVIGPNNKAIRFSYLFPDDTVLIMRIEEARPDLFQELTDDAGTI